MADDYEEDDFVDMMDMDPPWPPLKSVFECPKIKLFIVNGKNGWTCILSWVCRMSCRPILGPKCCVRPTADDMLAYTLCRNY